MANSCDQVGQEAFSVTLAASARVNLQDHITGEISPHIIHAVSVAQPVQSWTVLRDHVDFLAMDVALGDAIPGLPSCVACPAPGVTHDSQQEVNAIVHARNAAQEWLSSVLMVPAVRESPVMRQFLCYGANVVPPQFEGLAWVNFTATGDSTVTNPPGTAGSASAYAAVPATIRSAPPRPNLDEMEMDDMFDLEDDPQDNHQDDVDGNSFDSEDDAEYLQGRFAPTEEPLTQSEIMEIQQDYKQVEMVEDVGSLAQSLGASHLGRSLNLQKEMMSFKQQQIKMGGQVQEMHGQTHNMQGGINIMAHSGNTIIENNQSISSSGIGGAMAKAESRSSTQPTQAHVAGVGDSFHRTPLVSAPGLDSFMMIKVIGKGSFGKLHIKILFIRH